ncbi:MAG: Lipopolysaccharide core biosynthesis protein RfaG [Chlamydiae bacterium]|nr:Lipopolysaccharide core biosynthesis protein RfaG [Chlamydiota bacterium]
MSRIAIIKSRISYLGGLEKYALSIAQAFAEKGSDVTILTTGQAPQKMNGVKVVSFESASKWGYFKIRQFDSSCNKWLKKHSMDLVFGFDRTSSLTHYRAGNGTHASFLKHKSPSLLKYYFSKFNPKDRLILSTEKKIFENTELKKLFTNSHMVRDELVKNYQINSSLIEVVFNGVDFEKLYWTRNTKKEAIAKLALSSSKTKFLFVGNNYKRKGLNFLLRAFSSIDNRSFELLVVGEDKQIQKYKSLAKKLGIETQVFFYGKQVNLLPYYSAADCFILPTAYDPFANVTLEALAMGLYVITSPFNGAKEILKKGCGTVLENLSHPAKLTSIITAFIEKKIHLLSKEEIRQSALPYESKSQINKIIELSLKNV